jgi:uncharacterized protein
VDFMTTASVLMVPGLSSSGPGHWQSQWEAKHPEYGRVQQENWDTPRCLDWVNALRAAIYSTRSGPVVLAGHSLGCVTIVHYAMEHADGGGRVKAAFLVAPTDVEAPTFPPGSIGFRPMPLCKLPFQSVVVASSNDPYVSLERAESFACAWGSRFVKVLNAGHINTVSGHGPWPEGEVWLQELASSAST